MLSRSMPLLHVVADVCRNVEEVPAPLFSKSLDLASRATLLPAYGIPEGESEAVSCLCTCALSALVATHVCPCAIVNRTPRAT